jgi:hypothetical protein
LGESFFEGDVVVLLWGDGVFVAVLVVLDLMEVFGEEGRELLLILIVGVDA